MEYRADDGGRTEGREAGMSTDIQSAGARARRVSGGGAELSSPGAGGSRKKKTRGGQAGVGGCEHQFVFIFFSESSVRNTFGSPLPFFLFS